MSSAVSVLFLEDCLRDFELVSEFIIEKGLNACFKHVSNRVEYESSLASERFDIILSDYAIPGYSGFAALQKAREKDPSLPFILLSGALREEEAVESLRAGATDYIIKQRLNRLVPAIRRAIFEAEEHRKRMAAEAQIRNQAALLDKARDAIILADMDGLIQYWNQSAERILGWSREEVLGEPLDLFLAGILQRKRKDLLTNDLWHGEIAIATKTGKRLVLESRWSVMRDPDEERPKGILLINTDVTEKKEIEAQLLRTQRIETIGALSGGIAHDLNNGLAPIIMAAELLRDEVKTNSGLRMLDMAVTSAKRCAEMVRQILAFSRGAGQGWALLDPSKIIDEVAELARETFPCLILIETDCEPGLEQFNGNVTQVHQVLMNLLINARDAMPTGGCINVVARNVQLHGHANHLLKRPAEGSYVMISVTDTGAGIPQEIVGRIFEPFFTTKEFGKGTGLGLSTVLSIMKSHEGFLEFKTALGAGTTFDLYFPARVVASDAHHADASRFCAVLG